MMGERICFVIAPIGEPDSETRRRSDQILKHVITPAAKECGYNTIRADKISEPGLITTQVIQHIVEDPLVMADLTERNPNVFYELAIRHAIKRPLIQMIKEGEQIPFDVAGTRTVHVDHQDLDSVEEAKREIVRQIQAVEQDELEIETPISVAIDLQILRQSENPEQRSMADLVSEISVLRTGLLSIEKKLSDPQALMPPDYVESIMRRSTRLSQRVSPRIIFELMEIKDTLGKIAKIESSTKNKKAYTELLNRLTQLQMYLDRYVHEY